MLAGLARARCKMRHQMSLIVNEVKLLAKNPVLASNPIEEPNPISISFQARLPGIEAPRNMSSIPLSGKEIVPELVVEDPGAPELFIQEKNLTAEETNQLNSVTAR